jgi:chaperonin cofactor prefoldin
MRGDDIGSNGDENAFLRSELKARVAEVAWVKAHYRQHLREALAALQASKGPVAEDAEEPRASVGSSSDSEQLAQLKTEIDRLKLSERRYLDRIAELKDLLTAKLAVKGKAS